MTEELLSAYAAIDAANPSRNAVIVGIAVPKRHPPIGVSDIPWFQKRDGNLGILDLMTKEQRDALASATNPFSRGER